ncbi:MAG: 50S ribosomal protein L11 [Thermoplasmata archaeon]|nr:50S ribosomal protein L11 [Thermoplasmata archaeon]
MPEVVEILIDGGEASPGPPLGPTLGPMGVNIMQIAGDINKKTGAFKGMKVPVKITIAEDKSYEIEVGTPPISALIKDELGLEKGASNPRTDKAGDMTIKQLVKICEMKGDSLLGATTKNKALEVTGSCVSMGIWVDGKPPKEAQRLLHEQGDAYFEGV